MVKRAKPGEQTERRRERLAVAGYDVMVRSGMANVRTREVATEAGITVATLHYYFPTKNDLVRAVVEYAISERIIVPVQEQATTASDAPEWLGEMLAGLREQAERDPGHFRLLHEMIWASHEDPELRVLLENWHGHWHEGVASCLRNGQRAGTVRADLDPPTTAQLIVYLAFSVVLRPPMPVDHGKHLPGELDRLLASLKPEESA
ncbi:AcrR family transcriptional regulator [Saccharopolyspora lacisalsi]|uniref:AcrR family transcriptional regulator n=1 Tax=Halosaccharopolyspora lacisalsi TaxID=1000566 RepID=A0A839DMM1_9PSEU|nr:TetR/AcrR family transcriptional regulator [Halosaccharopolyspora lacisalsi]MBA8822754.1 AcrR family transcriptional regulator [Halosaccharopolyspora lacisalsi]